MKTLVKVDSGRRRSTAVNGCRARVSDDATLRQGVVTLSGDQCPREANVYVAAVRDSDYNHPSIIHHGCGSRIHSNHATRMIDN